MMIPDRIKQFFLLTDQRQDGENTLVSGQLLCCEQTTFSLRTVGTVQRGLLHRMSLSPSAEGLAIRAACIRCGRDILVFDAGSDGYDNCFSRAGETSFSTAGSVQCMKCGGGIFYADLRFEYPDWRELADLGCTNPENAFTWIWISLTCSACGKRYTDFISHETA